jgi:hypothetical protein
LVDYDVLYLMQARVYTVNLVFENLALCLLAQVRVLGQELLRDHFLAHIARRVRQLPIQPYALVNAPHRKPFPLTNLKRRRLHLAIEQPLKSELIFLRQVVAIPVNLPRRLNEIPLKDPVGLFLHHVDLHHLDIVVFFHLFLKFFEFDLRLVHLLEFIDVFFGNSAFKDFGEEQVTLFEVFGRNRAEKDLVLLLELLVGL